MKSKRLQKTIIMGFCVIAALSMFFSYAQAASVKLKLATVDGSRGISC